MSLLHRHTAALAEIEWTNECFVCDAWIPPGVGREVLIHADDCAWLEALELVELSEELGLYECEWCKGDGLEGIKDPHTQCYDCAGNGWRWEDGRQGTRRMSDRHTQALAEIEWTNECLVCGAYTVPHSQGHHYVLDHTDDCAWAEARNTIGGRRTQTKYER